MDGVLFFIFLLVMWVVAAERAARKKRIRDAYDFRPENVLAGARYADKRDLKRAGLFRSRGICIGFSRFRWLRRLYYNGAGHLLVVAGARTGKAVTVIVGAILRLPRRYSLLVFDPKGELASICGHYLKKHGTVYVLNPFGILRDSLKGLKQARFNPMSSLDPKSRSFHADCDKLADAICWEEGSHCDSHWIISARLLISGIIAALAKYGAPSERNLVALRNVITGSTGRSVFDFCRECMNVPDIYVRQKLARFAAKDAEESRELNGIISTADT